jgi:hypothetical protein
LLREVISEIRSLVPEISEKEFSSKLSEYIESSLVDIAMRVSIEKSLSGLFRNRLEELRKPRAPGRAAHREEKRKQRELFNAILELKGAVREPSRSSSQLSINFSDMTSDILLPWYAKYDGRSLEPTLGPTTVSSNDMLKKEDVEPSPRVTTIVEPSILKRQTLSLAQPKIRHSVPTLIGTEFVIDSSIQEKVIEDPVSARFFSLVESSARQFALASKMKWQFRMQEIDDEEIPGWSRFVVWIKLPEADLKAALSAWDDLAARIRHTLSEQISHVPEPESVRMRDMDKHLYVQMDLA